MLPTARSPAKLILTGEHSVVYGKPALAMAVDRYVESTVSFRPTPTIFFNLLNLKYAKSLTLSTLKELKMRAHKDYRRFLAGECSIREVLEKPFELLQFTVSHMLEHLNVSLSHGVNIKTQSSIPIGCGMGSSAATIISTLRAVMHFLKIEFDPIKLLHLGREAENLQHGRSSGLDLHLALYGGCVRFENGKAVDRAIPNMTMFLVNTGAPVTTTGESVSYVRKQFESSSIWEEFETVTNEMDQAFAGNVLHEVYSLVRTNHRLLTDIGVVPSKVQSFIQDLEARGACAKVCGAGAVLGDNAGVVLVITPHNIHDIVERYRYTMHSIQADHYGTKIL